VRDSIYGTLEMQSMANPMTSQLMWISKNRGAPAAFHVVVSRTNDLRMEGGPLSELNNSTSDTHILETWQAATRPAEAMFGAVIQIDAVRKTYSVNLALNRVPDRQLVHHRVTYSDGTQKDEDMDLGALEFGNLSAPQFNAKDLPLGSDVTHIIGSHRFTIPRPSGWKGGWDYAYEITWELTGHLPPVELIVSSDDYASWRPTAKPGPTPGDPIAFHAELQTSEGDPPAVKVKRFEWTLQDTSREPGIAMNYPLASDDVSYDLKLRPANGQTAVGDDGQEIVREDPEGHADTASVDPYDWGGWSTLHVKAILEDGRVITGHLRNGTEDIPLPKRTKDSKIADIWKSNVPNAGADDADDETTDIGVPNAPGDGFTLYEEYRGFYENQKHINGDPTKKDFFVLNLVGPDAVPGIDLFEDLSELKVHSRLRTDEMGQQARLMNGNHHDGAHRVDQHGVWIKTMDAYNVRDGAVTVANESGVAGRPGLTKGIGIRSRDDADTLFTQSFNLSATDAVFSYDRAVAHELFHTVGVDHHGEDNSKGMFRFHFADDPRNPTGKPVFFIGYSISREIAYIIDEKTKEDLATKMAPAMEAARARIKANNWDRYLQEGQALLQSSGPSPAMLINSAEDYAWYKLDEVCADPGLFFTIGEQNGVESGDEECVMRYSFAQLYRTRGKPATFYLITKGDHIGMKLCTSPAGTGRNAEGNDPQSRFGPAKAGFGNCASQVCPNDAIPPRKL